MEGTGRGRRGERERGGEGGKGEREEKERGGERGEGGTWDTKGRRPARIETALSVCGGESAVH
jgi:DNA-binding protein H-NS